MSISFKDYAQSKGITLNHEDIRLIKQSLKRFDTDLHHDILDAYTTIWLKYSAEAETENGREMAGRCIANRWLVEIPGRTGANSDFDRSFLNNWV